MKNRAEQGGKGFRVNLITKGWIILLFPFAGTVVLLPLAVVFTDQKRQRIGNGSMA
ncbi:hypothetical protein [Dysgonomonas reticulitermitis]